MRGFADLDLLFKCLIACPPTGGIKDYILLSAGGAPYLERPK